MEDLLRVTGSSIEDGIRVLGSGFEDLLKATGSTLEDLLKAGFGGLSAQQAGQAEAERRAQLATRTTDNLFGQDLFKFDVQQTPEYDLVQLQKRYKA